MHRWEMGGTQTAECRVPRVRVCRVQTSSSKQTYSKGQRQEWQEEEENHRVYIYRRVSPPTPTVQPPPPTLHTKYTYTLQNIQVGAFDADVWRTTAVKWAVTGGRGACYFCFGNNFLCSPVVLPKTMRRGRMRDVRRFFMKEALALSMVCMPASYAATPGGELGCSVRPYCKVLLAYVRSPRPYALHLAPAFPWRVFLGCPACICIIQPVFPLHLTVLHCISLSLVSRGIPVHVSIWI